jgi:hypothetical protein
LKDLFSIDPLFLFNFFTDAIIWNLIIFTGNDFTMTTIIINEKTKKGRIILDLIRELGAGEILNENNIAQAIPNHGYEPQGKP